MHCKGITFSNVCHFMLVVGGSDGTMRWITLKFIMELRSATLNEMSVSSTGKAERRLSFVEKSMNPELQDDFKLASTLCQLESETLMTCIAPSALTRTRYLLRWNRLEPYNSCKPVWKLSGQPNVWSHLRSNRLTGYKSF